MALEAEKPVAFPVALGGKTVVDHVYVGHPLRLAGGVRGRLVDLI